MKKALIAIGLVLLAVSGVFAQIRVEGQTYYYKYVETVDTETGMRSFDNQYIKDSWTGFLAKELYLTFTGNACYASDEKGIAKYVSGFYTDGIDDSRIFKYQGKQNYMRVYMQYSDIFNPSRDEIKTKITLNFSRDFSRINVIYNYEIIPPGNGPSVGRITSYPNRVYIYEQPSPPRPTEPPKPSVPDRMW